MLNTYTMNIGDEAFEVIAEGGEYDYSWSMVALLRSPEGRLYFASDSGCSCNSFGDYFRSRADLTPVASWQEAAKLAFDSIEGQYAIRFAERLGELRPVNA